MYALRNFCMLPQLKFVFSLHYIMHSLVSESKIKLVWKKFGFANFIQQFWTLANQHKYFLCNLKGSGPFWKLSELRKASLFFFIVNKWDNFRIFFLIELIFCVITCISSVLAKWTLLVVSWDKYWQNIAKKTQKNKN